MTAIELANYAYWQRTPRNYRLGARWSANASQQSATRRASARSKRRRSQNRRSTRAPASLRERRSNKWVAMMNDIDELIASAAADLDALTRKLDRLRTSAHSVWPHRSRQPL
jgi:hypothetical protein